MLEAHHTRKTPCAAMCSAVRDVHASWLRAAREHNQLRQWDGGGELLHEIQRKQRSTNARRGRMRADDENGHRKSTANMVRFKLGRLVYVVRLGFA